MLSKEEKLNLKRLISDTVVLLCKRGLVSKLKGQLCIEGLIGITLEEDDLMLVNIQETVLGCDSGTVYVEDHQIAETEIQSPVLMLPKRAEKRKSTSEDENECIVTKISRNHNEILHKQLQPCDANHQFQTQMIQHQHNSHFNQSLFNHNSIAVNCNNFENVAVKLEPTITIDNQAASEIGFIQINDSVDQHGIVASNQLVMPVKMEHSFTAQTLPQIINSLNIPNNFQTITTPSTNVNAVVFNGGSVLTNLDSPNRNYEHNTILMEQQLKQTMSQLPQQPVTLPQTTIPTTSPSPKIKKHQCPECEKSFTQKFTLTRHLLIHSGEKPFHCTECGHSFRHRGNLKKHTMTHTGEKPHKCPYCIQCFSQSNSLKVHVRTHTGEKPYKCAHCGQMFRQRGNWKKHIVIHVKDEESEQDGFTDVLHYTP